MINSLLKDSHMTQGFCRPNFGNQSQKRNSSKNLPTPVSNGTIINPSDNFSKPAKNVSFGGFFSAENLAKNKRFIGWIEKADANPLLFDSTFALILTCIFRPGAIMALPSDKKNKDDKTYAAAHSIASGVISYGISLLITSPISEAFKKIQGDVSAVEKNSKTETKYIKNKDSYLFKLGDVINKKTGEVIKKQRNANNAGTYIKKLPEIFIALPRATITIALIPVILKYVFGMEKKKKLKQGDNMIPISENLAAINQNKINNDKNVKQNVKIKFGSSIPKSSSKFFDPAKKCFKPIVKAYESATESIANALVKILHLSPIKSIVEKTAKNDHLNENLFTHLTAFTSVVLSSFYIKKTLDNDKLDDKKKKTLAINQAVVTVLSTIAAYTVEKIVDKKFEAFTEDFCKNAGSKHYEKGLKYFKTTVIFGTIYRFIAPVFATPIANYIGNKFHEQNELKQKTQNAIAANA